MKRTLSIALTFCAVLLYSNVLIAHGEEEHKPIEVKKDAANVEHHHGEEVDIDEKVVEGEIIDITCYIRHDSKGPDHLKCAEYCTTLGMPFGFIEDKTNKIYLILPPEHDNPIEPYKEYIAKKVKVKGLIYMIGGMTGLEIESIEEI